MTRIVQNLPEKLTPGPSVVFPLTEMVEVDLRGRLIIEARTWIKTPYRQLGDVKGVAVDCSMLLVRCLVDTGIIEPFDPRPYPPSWFIHQADERYIDWLEVVAVEVSTPKAGDFVAFRIGRAFAHSGIMTGPDTLVHAFADEGRVSESPLRIPALSFVQQTKKPREKRFFDVFARLRANGPA